MKNYYVYSYLDQNNVPFYVGKGKNGRYRILYHLHEPNKFLFNKIQKLGQENVQIVFIHQNLSEEQAFLYEKVWIKLIGRRDLGLGPLCNLTDGGEGGGTGKITTEATKLRISQSLKGKPHRNNNQELSEEHRHNISIALRGRVSPTKGKKHSEESKKLISTSMKNLVLTEKKIEQLRIARSKRSKETMKKIGLSNFGKIRSEEAKQKMSESQKLAWANGVYANKAKIYKTKRAA